MKARGLYLSLAVLVMAASWPAQAGEQRRPVMHSRMAPKSPQVAPRQMPMPGRFNSLPYSNPGQSPQGRPAGLRQSPLPAKSPVDRSQMVGSKPRIGVPASPSAGARGSMPGRPGRPATPPDKVGKKPPAPKKPDPCRERCDHGRHHDCRHRCDRRHHDWPWRRGPWGTGGDRSLSVSIQQASTILDPGSAGPVPVPVPADNAPSDEQTAAAKLKLARTLLEAELTDDACEYCKDIIDKYPTTKGAEGAVKMLEQIRKR